MFSLAPECFVPPAPPVAGGTGGETTTGGGNNEQEYDNPLYNCGDGGKTNCPGNRAGADQDGEEGSVGAPGFLESLIPVWGPGRAAVNDFQQGNYGWALANAGFAVSDALVVGAVWRGVGRGALKLGSNLWGATRKWYGKIRNVPKGTEVHHWLIQQRGRFGRYVPDIVKNQPWNLNRCPIDRFTTLYTGRAQTHSTLSGASGMGLRRGQSRRQLQRRVMVGWPMGLVRGRSLMLGTGDLTYPVLAIAKDGTIGLVANRANLEVCGNSALKSGYFDELTLVDSTGRCAQVREARPVEYVGPFWGWRLFRSRCVRVTLDLSVRATYDLPRLKARLLEAINQFPDLWEAAEGGSTEAKARVSQAESIPELIDAIGE